MRAGCTWKAGDASEEIAVGLLTGESVGRRAAGGFKRRLGRLGATLRVLFGLRRVRTEALRVEVRWAPPFSVPVSHILRRRYPPLPAEYCSKPALRSDRPPACAVRNRIRQKSRSFFEVRRFGIRCLRFAPTAEMLRICQARDLQGRPEPGVK